MEHIERKAQKSNATLAICITALFMALNIMMSSFGLPVPGGHLYLNDVIICTAAPMFVSLVTHGIQAVVICLLAHRGGKVSFKGAALGVILGAVIMVVGYSLGRAFIYSTPHYAYIKLPYQILQAAVGAVGGLVLCFKAGLLEHFDSFFICVCLLPQLGQQTNYHNILL